MAMRGLKAAIRVIRESKSIAISGHINPDGDCIGSLLALGLGLEKTGKKVFMISPDGVPKKYKQLPGAKRIKRTLKTKVDLAITVDCNAIEMLGSAYKTFKRAKHLLEIDHHLVRSHFGDMELIDAEAAAVGEQIYFLLKNLKVKITENIAQNILTSLIVETNSFRLPNARPLTFRLCAELAKTGVDFYKLVDTVYWSNPKEVALLSGIALSRSTFLKGGRLVWSILKQEDFKKVKGNQEDADAIADQLRAIKGVDIVIFFRENNKKKLRVSLRSKLNINIAELAEQHGGGGHSDVAGCVIPNTLKARQALLRGAETMLK